MSFLFFVNRNLFDGDGVTNKILDQNKAFTTLFPKAHFIHINNKQRVSNKGMVSSFFGLPIEIAKRYFFKGTIQYIKKAGVKVVYVRYGKECGLFYLLFLAKLKSLGCKIYLEVPTYPYDNEHSFSVKTVRGLLMTLLKLEERIFRRYMHKYLYRIVTFSGEKEILNTKTVMLSNAVSKDLKMITQTQTDTIRLVGVASLAHWHGYDRLINSIAKSNVKNKVEFHIVGDGTELLAYQKLANELKINNQVIFHGKLSGGKLDEVICSCHIGVDSLGRHRGNVFINSSLKSKEYFMRGLPLIKSHIDYAIEETKWAYSLPADESLFSIEAILDWYHSLSPNSNEIRSYTVNNFTWLAQFKKLELNEG